MHKKALLSGMVTVALILTLVVANFTPGLAQGSRGQVLVEHTIVSPRDAQSGVVSPRDPASGLPTGIISPRDPASGQSSG